MHGTTRQRPAEVFAVEELSLLRPFPAYIHPKVARSACRSLQARYSIRGGLIGQRLTAREDERTVKLFWRAQLIKVHLRQAPDSRHTDPADLPSELTAVAMRDLDALHRKAAAHGDHVGVYAAALLEHPLPNVPSFTAPTNAPTSPRNTAPAGFLLSRTWSSVFATSTQPDCVFPPL